MTIDFNIAFHSSFLSVNSLLTPISRILTCIPYLSLSILCTLHLFVSSVIYYSLSFDVPHFKGSLSVVYQYKHGKRKTWSIYQRKQKNFVPLGLSYFTSYLFFPSSIQLSANFTFLYSWVILNYICTKFCDPFICWSYPFIYVDFINSNISKNVFA